MMARRQRRGAPGRLRMRGLWILIVLATLVVFVPAAVAQTDDPGDVGTVAQEEDDPYSAVLSHVEPPDWLERLGPLAELPVWASAAIISAAVAAVVFFVPVAIRWAWTLSATRDSET